jgi:hypothetical protein
MASFCEHGNEVLGSIKKGNYSLTNRVTTNFSKNIMHHGDSIFFRVNLHAPFASSLWLNTELVSCGLSSQVL